MQGEREGHTLVVQASFVLAQMDMRQLTGLSEITVLNSVLHLFFTSFLAIEASKGSP